MNTNFKTLLFYPFVRLLAGAIDLLIADLIFLTAIRMSGHQLDNLSVKWIVVGTLILCFLVIEPILLATWGKTFGSWLMKINLSSHDNKLGYFKALGRSLIFLTFGLAFGINVIVLAVLVVANYFYFLRTGEFCWDKWLDVDTGQENPGVLKLLFVLAIVAVVLFIGGKASISSTAVTNLNIQKANNEPQFATPEQGYQFINGKYQKPEQ